jgi:hypothetical protein
MEQQAMHVNMGGSAAVFKISYVTVPIGSWRCMIRKGRQSASQSVGQSVGQSVIQPTNQPASQPAKLSARQ